MPLINLSYPETVIDLNLGSSSEKLGGIVNLSEFTELTSFVCKSNDIQYDDSNINDNKIKHFIVSDNKIEKLPRLDKYPELKILDFKNNNVLLFNSSTFFSNYFKEPTNSLVYVNLAENGFTGTVPTVTALPDLEGFDLSANNFTTYEDSTANGGYNENLLYFNLQDNHISDVNQLNSILINLSSGGGSNGYVNLSGGTMAIPDGLGEEAKFKLLVRGWTVLVNSLDTDVIGLENENILGTENLVSLAIERNFVTGSTVLVDSDNNFIVDDDGDPIKIDE